MAVGMIADWRLYAAIGRNAVAERKTSKRSRAVRAQTVHLPVHLDIAAVSELKQTLSASLATARELVLDASAVEHVDCAGMQLLLAFRLAARQQGYTVRWANMPARLTDAAALLGMSVALECDA